MKRLLQFREWMWRYAEEGKRVPALQTLSTGFYLYIMGVESVNVGQSAFVLWTARISAWVFLLFYLVIWLTEWRKPLTH